MKKTLNFGIIGPGSHFKKNIAPVLKKIDKIKVIKAKLIKKFNTILGKLFLNSIIYDF